MLLMGVRSCLFYYYILGMAKIAIDDFGHIVIRLKPFHRFRELFLGYYRF